MIFRPFCQLIYDETAKWGFKTRLSLVCYVTGQMLYVPCWMLLMLNFFFFSWPFWTLWPPKCRYFSFFRLHLGYAHYQEFLGEEKILSWIPVVLWLESWYIHVCWNVFIIFFSLKCSVGVSRSRIQWPSSISENATQLRCDSCVKFVDVGPSHRPILWLIF